MLQGVYTMVVIVCSVMGSTWQRFIFRTLRGSVGGQLAGVLGGAWL